ncbi:MAG TPA: hypothetical protein VN963_05200, partial [bacterium]|nr:hypothetical protein [bacterium]
MKAPCRHGYNSPYFQLEGDWKETVMYLNYRLTELSDLEACFPYIRDRFHYDEGLKKDILPLWKTLIEEGCCISQVIEDRDQPADRRLVGFGISFFATDRFMAEAKSTLPP